MRLWIATVVVSSRQFSYWQVSQRAPVAFTFVLLLLALLFRRLEVEGPSMLPTFVPGEIVTAVRRWRPVRVGDVVVLRDPSEPERWLVKRCVAKSKGHLDVRGDNGAASTDSRDFGPVKAREVRWIVLGHRSR
jgi:nickel-type superoxide dismutase maturation protease